MENNLEGRLTTSDRLKILIPFAIGYLAVGYALGMYNKDAIQDLGCEYVDYFGTLQNCSQEYSVEK